MKRTATGLGIAAAVACAVTLGAQTSTTTAQRTSSTTDKAKEVTVTGCLAKDTSGSGFMLNNAKMDNGASSTTTTSGSTTATSGTNASSMSSGPAMNWTLSGGNDLDKHVGHKIAVTGKTTWDSSMNHTSSAASPAGAGTTAATPDPTTTAGAATAGTTGTREGSSRGMQPRLDVESIKMISTSCS